MTPQELASVRQHCLLEATKEAAAGTPWDAILRLAKRFEDYIVTGDVPDKAEDK